MKQTPLSKNEQKESKKHIMETTTTIVKIRSQNNPEIIARNLKLKAMW